MRLSIRLAVLGLTGMAGIANAGATNFVVTVPAGPFRFLIDGVEHPVLNLQRGTTYTFQGTQSCLHQLVLTLSGTGGFGTVAYTTGVTGSGACASATLTFTPSAATPDVLFYVCANHAGMGNQINVTSPVPPCPGDVNGDHTTNGLDLSVLLGQFSTNVTPGTGADLNADGFVSGADLSVMLANFGCKGGG